MREAADRVLASGKVNYWTGEEGKAFERDFAAFLGAPHAVAVSNGTVALELALQALDVGPGDEVVVSPRTFVASASCVLARGAVPRFADVDPDSGTLTAATVERALTPKTRAVIPVHLGGWPCEMDPILDLARRRGLRVVEDVAQATGGTYRDRALGTLGDVGAFSFCQDKILTTAGEGGLVVTKEPALRKRIWGLKDHGKDYDACFYREHPPGFRWLHEGPGGNGRMTEVQAAVGRVALRRLPEWIAARRRNARIWIDAFSTLPALRVPLPGPGLGHPYYKFYAYVRPERLKSDWSRDRIMTEATAAGVPTFSGSCSEIYLEKAFDGPGLRPAGRLPVARELGETSLMWMVHPTLTEEVLRESAEKVSALIAAATR
jgi:hypothetical protein